MPDGTFKWIDKPGPFKRRSYADNQELAIPKVGVRLKDPAGIRRFKRPICEVCGFAPCDPTRISWHHLKTKGSGGFDTEVNGLNLCLRCHDDAHHARIPKELLEQIISARIGRAIIIDEESFNPPQKIIHLPGKPAPLETSECCSCGDLFEGEAGEFYCVPCRQKNRSK